MTGQSGTTNASRIEGRREAARPRETHRLWGDLQHRSRQLGRSWPPWTGRVKTHIHGARAEDLEGPPPLVLTR